MKRAVALMLSVAGLGEAVHGQTVVMRTLVSTDGGSTWSSSVNCAPGDHVEAMVTVSYNGTSTNVVGLGSCMLQPIVSNWDTAGTGTHVDRLSPLGQGGNVLGSMVNAQTNTLSLGAPNPYLTPSPGTSGTMVPAAPYAAGTYGRVYPMGRTYMNGITALTGFVHDNPPPDQTGRVYPAGTYLRIAQGVCPDWFGQGTNFGGSGVGCAQLFLVGRTTNDPDFWGNRDSVYDAGDPANGIPASYSLAANGHNDRRQNIQLFRFGIDLSDDPNLRQLLVDTPLAGMDVDTGGRQVNFFSPDPAQVVPTIHLIIGASGVQTAQINIIPGPSTLATALIGLAALPRRRR